MPVCPCLVVFPQVSHLFTGLAPPPVQGWVSLCLRWSIALQRHCNDSWSGLWAQRRVPKGARVAMVRLIFFSPEHMFLPSCFANIAVNSIFTWKAFLTAACCVSSLSTPTLRSRDTKISGAWDKRWFLPHASGLDQRFGQSLVQKMHSARRDRNR